MSTEWLAAHLDDRDLAVVDMRWRGDGSGHDLYDREHVPGAVHLDWSLDIVDPDHEIAFMLAPAEMFAAALAERGIGDDTAVVAYADEGGSGPHRLWWACRVYGHDQVRILDGGWEKWNAEGRPISDVPKAPPAATWTPRPGAGLIAYDDDVQSAQADGGVIVLDSRPAQQYRGETVWFETGPVPADEHGIAHTPRGDLRAGHIPWARNIPAAELYRDDGTMKPPDELRALFAGAGVEPGASVVTHCGVGISASALLFALHQAGIEDARLYDASWEEWGRDPSRPVVRD